MLLPMVAILLAPGVTDQSGLRQLEDGAHETRDKVTELLLEAIDDAQGGVLGQQPGFLLGFGGGPDIARLRRCIHLAHP